MQDAPGKSIEHDLEGSGEVLCVGGDPGSPFDADDCPVAQQDVVHGEASDAAASEADHR
jgi:hypothetical protein